MGDYWKKECFKERKKASYAWGQYFQLQQELFEIEESIYIWHNANDDDGKPIKEIVDGSDLHLQNFIRGLYKKAKESIECPICLDVIDYKQLDTTACGHNFHKECLKTIKDGAAAADEKHIECPICRNKIYIKKK